MTILFQREVEALRKKVLAEAAMVEEAVDKALRAFIDHNEGLANEVMDGDRQIDELEIDIEEDCLRILALYKPVAVDLRFIVMVIRMNNDLERMGDITVNIARRASFLARRDPQVALPDGLDHMGACVRTMIKESLDALIHRDAALAEKVCRDDDEVDRLKRNINRQVREAIRLQPDQLKTHLKMMDVSRHLERLADLATNIAEDVIYFVRGEIVRHRHALEEEPA